mgnify:FL=1
MKVKTTFPKGDDLETIKQRDKICVYCSKKIYKPDKDVSRTKWATIEHFNHRSDWDSVGNYIREGKPVSEIVGMCCWSCNSSRSNKKKRVWFKTEYCLSRDINEKTVSKPVQEYIINVEDKE